MAAKRDDLAAIKASGAGTQTMNTRPTWWHWFSTGPGTNTAIALFNAMLIGIMWNAVFGLVRTERQDAIRAAIDRNDNLAIAFEQYTVRTLQRADAVTQYLVREYVSRRGEMDLAKFMADYTLANNVIIGVVLADERGNAMTTAYSDIAKPLNVADREHFKVHIGHNSGRIFVGKPVLGRVTGQGVIPVTRRIDKADGTFGGVAMALIEPARFTDVLHDARLRPLDVISLVGLDGITRARLKGSTASWGEDIGKSPLFAAQARHPVGNFFTEGQLDKVPRFFSYKTLPDLQLMTIVGAAEADVMAEFYYRQNRYFWAAGLTSAIIAGFAVLLMLALTRQRRGVAAIARSELRFRQIAENIHDVFFLRDADGNRMLYVSPAYEAIWGRSRDSLYANPESWVEAIYPEDRALTYEEAKKGTSTGTFELEYRIVRPDGSIRWIESRGFPVPDDTGKIVRIAGVAKDMTERKKAEARIAYLSRVYAMLSRINTLIVRVSDRDELFRGACRIAIDTGHFAKAWLGMLDVVSKQIRVIAAHGGDSLFFSNLEEELNSGLLTGSGLVTRALKTRQPVVSNDLANDPEVLLKESAVHGGARSLAMLPLLVSGEPVGVFTLNADTPDFFDQEEMKLLTELAGNIAFTIDHLDKQARLDYLAYYDALTGLANRSLFLERLAQHMRSAAGGAHKLAVFLVDLERFKNISDSLGRTAGDELLRQVAEWLTGYAVDVNALARVGADHFAMVLPEVKQEGDLARLVEKAMQAFMAHPFRLNDAVFRIAAKVGVALFPDDGGDADTVLRNAEAALKKAKASGERYLFHTQTMTAPVAGKLNLENQLRQAIDKEEFVLHYQPKVNLASGKMTSAEALIRWNDPRTGLVPPGRFIPILEETGLIFEVGRWALRQAIQDYLRWRSAGLPAVRIAVNVSPLQLRHRGFIAEIERKIGIHVHAPAGLELEITESLIMEDVKHNIASLKAIRDMGVSIAIDDFGTGFSSLSYLAKLPVDTLKIDRSFVIDMTAAPEGLALVSTIIKLAHSLKLKVVAEGVETEEQSRLLRLLACDEMQGFLFSKPVPADIFEANFLAPGSGA
jgi:diguanylate cyclase (GGDEF)-like protein/PAS domain S-box-containing protein